MVTIIFKAVEKCNSNCIYCGVIKKRQNVIMHVDLLREVLQKLNDYLLKYPNETLKITWHGGEVCLLGAAYFYKAIELLENSAFQQLKCVRVCGLMGMATFTDDTEAIRSEFRGLNDFFKRIRNDYFHSDPSFCELSMGMSDDYKIAIEEGATMVRIGSSIFGKRNNK